MFAQAQATQGTQMEAAEEYAERVIDACAQRGGDCAAEIAEKRAVKPNCVRISVPVTKGGKPFKTIIVQAKWPKGKPADVKVSGYRKKPETLQKDLATVDLTKFPYGDEDEDIEDLVSDTG